MAETKKSMDVSKPEDTTPDATSRPIIVGHKMIQQDPMVSPKAPEDTSETESSSDKKPISHAEKVVQPTSAAIDETKAAETPQEKDSEKTDESVESTIPESDEAAVVDAVAEQARANKKNSGEPTEEDKKKQAEVTKLIGEKKYFVPIKVASQKRNARLSTILLIILLLLVGAYLVIDAGFINPGFKLPIEIIKN